MNAVSQQTLLPILISAGSLVLMAGIVYLTLKWMRYALRKRLAPLRDALGGELLESFWRGTYLQLNHDGVEARIGVTMGGRNSPPTLTIQRFSPLPFKLVVLKENVVTRGLMRLGALKETKLGVPAFDDRFFVRTGDELAATAHLMENSRFQVVAQLFDAGFTLVQGGETMIFLSKPYYRDGDLQPPQMQSYLDQMKRLAA